MSATIVTVGPDKRLQLLNSQITRRPSYLNNWTTIRIGLRFMIPSASSIPGSPRLYIGMCNGLTNGIGDSVTTNFVGFMTNVASFVRSTSVGPPAGVYTQNNGFRFVKKVASTINFNAGDVTSGLMMSMQATVRHAIIVQITKGSPNYTAGFAFLNGTVGNGHAIDLTDLEMQGLMEMNNMGDASTVSPVYSGGIAFSNSSIATDEVAGVFNAINIFWDRTAAPVEISDIYHRKVA